MKHPDKWEFPRRKWWNPFDITSAGDKEMEEMGYPKPRDGIWEGIILVALVVVLGCLLAFFDPLGLGCT